MKYSLVTLLAMTIAASIGSTVAQPWRLDSEYLVQRDVEFFEDLMARKAPNPADYRKPGHPTKIAPIREVSPVRVATCFHCSADVRSKILDKVQSEYRNNFKINNMLKSVEITYDATTKEIHCKYNKGWESVGGVHISYSL